MYLSFIHSYINCANIVWASTNHAKLKKIINNEEGMTNSRALMKSVNALNL